MTKVKICGISRLSDVEALNIAKPDYAGFIFAKSPRQVDFETAMKLRESLDKDILTVGVFVDEAIETVVEYAKSGVVDVIQLHGSEKEEYIKKVKDLTGKKVIKAVAVTSVGDVEKWKNSCADYILFDNKIPGSGETLDWNVIKGFDRSFFLAGGLSIENINEAIEQTRPYAVDVNSGVETSGVKDFDKIIAIVENVRYGK